jgi:hypothetical protein
MACVLSFWEGLPGHAPGGFSGHFPLSDTVPAEAPPPYTSLVPAIGLASRCGRKSTLTTQHPSHLRGDALSMRSRMPPSAVCTLPDLPAVDRGCLTSFGYDNYEDA